MRVPVAVDGWVDLGVIGVERLLLVIEMGLGRLIQLHMGPNDAAPGRSPGDSGDAGCVQSASFRPQ